MAKRQNDHVILNADKILKSLRDAELALTTYEKHNGSIPSWAAPIIKKLENIEAIRHQLRPIPDLKKSGKGGKPQQ